jgi:hypothetical protein
MSGIRFLFACESPGGRCAAAGVPGDSWRRDRPSSRVLASLPAHEPVNRKDAMKEKGSRRLLPLRQLAQERRDHLSQAIGLFERKTVTGALDLAVLIGDVAVAHLAKRGSPQKLASRPAQLVAANATTVFWATESGIYTAPK